MASVNWTRDGAVATVILDRPEKLNALDATMLDELEAVFSELRADLATRAVILTGAGEKAFVAGADIAELARQTPVTGKQTARRGQTLFRAIELFPKPVVAAVNGFALGGGCELALACHVRLASENAQFGLPEVSLGIIPGYGGTQRLARVAGPAVAREWILTGDQFSAEEAHRVGVINRLFAPPELRAGTMKLVETILSRGPVAVRFAIEAINRGSNIPQREGEILECDLFGLAASTEDMREGMAAFVEKRKPNFKGK
jgi:enoyl-CoA hydratase